jgi:cytochrome c oxidase assembly protein subunit 15
LARGEWPAGSLAWDDIFAPKDALPVLLSHSSTAAAPPAETMPKAVRAWLLTLALLVLLIVSVGGATRLTGSGLSITEWQPIVGTIPPLTEADWQQAFAKYRQIPQYERVNRGMDLQAFKAIFWWEWAHRLLGRLIGVVLLVPLVYFLFTRQITPGLFTRLGALLLLGAVQGAAGWYMVYSGLSGRIDVSPYRLALHLALAMTIYGALITLALGHDVARMAPARRGIRSAALIVGLVFLQMVLGAFVAGLRAGLSYNTWPLMDGRLIPVGLGVMEPWYLNLFENALTVQFDHRLVAYLLLAATLAHAWWVRASAPGIKRGALLLVAAVVAQAGLGIWTLLEQVPLPLALTHQAAAAGLFAVALWHFHAFRQHG